MGAFEPEGFSQASGAVSLIERFISYIFNFHNFDRERPRKLMLIYCTNKWSAVPWALRLQRVVLQGSFASWALLYFRVKPSTLGPLLQGSGAVIEGLFSGRALRLRVSLFN
jgi:hypothetical protein